MKRRSDAYNCERCKRLCEGWAYRVTTGMVDRWDNEHHMEDHLLCKDCELLVHRLIRDDFLVLADGRAKK